MEIIAFISLELLKRRARRILRRREAFRKNKQEVINVQGPTDKTETAQHCVLETAEEIQANAKKAWANRVYCGNCNWTTHGGDCLLHSNDYERIRHALAGECDHFATRETVKEYHDSGRDWLDEHYYQ